VNKTILGTGTGFLYDLANPVQELSGTTPSASLLTGALDEYFTRADSFGTRNFPTDALGSSLALADASGALQTSYSFEPFGNTSSTGAATTNRFAYTGRELDAGNLNLYFFRARYYNPVLQRFISEDPIGLAGGDSNFYAYVLNAPLDFIDPTGLDWQFGVTGGWTLILAPIGVNGSVGGGISTGWTLRGTRFFSTEQLTGGVGAGLYSGGGLGFLVGHTPGPLTSGSSWVLCGEADAGRGASGSIGGCTNLKVTSRELKAAFACKGLYP
jgi:RHS repeat-associated protein